MVYWLFLWTLELTDLRRDVKLGPHSNPAPSQSSYISQLPTVCTSAWGLQCGGPQGQLDPSQEKGSLRSLILIQATKAFNELACACIQLCTRDGRGQRMWLGPLLQGALFAGRGPKCTGREEKIGDKRQRALVFQEGNSSSRNGIVKRVGVLVKSWPRLWNPSGDP